MPYPNEHAARLKDPAQYERFRRENDKFGEGIHAIWGIKADGTVELQAIRFDKERFTPEQARKWLKEHDYSPLEFEPASSSESKLSTVERTAILLEQGEYPDKQLIIDDKLMESLVENFNEPAPVVIEHNRHSIRLGWLAEIWRKGKQLFGKLVLKRSASELIDESGVKGVSVGLLLDESAPKIEEVSVTARPRISAAHVFSSSAAAAILDSSGELLPLDEQLSANKEVCEVSNLQEESASITAERPDSALLLELHSKIADLEQQLNIEREKTRQMLIQLKQREADIRLNEWKQSGKILPAQEPYAQALLHHLIVDEDNGRMIRFSEGESIYELPEIELIERMLAAGAAAVNAQLGSALPHEAKQKSLSKAAVPGDIERIFRERFHLEGDELDRSIQRYIEMCEKDTGGEE